MKPGQSKWFVGTIGLPGQERVINVGRDEWFEAGANPTIASVEQALVAKYGKPTKRQNSSGQRHFTWSYDPAVRQITETSPLFNRCSGSAGPDGGVNLSPDCGTVVSALVLPLRENPDLTQSMQLAWSTRPVATNSSSPPSEACSRPSSSAGRRKLPRRPRTPTHRSCEAAAVDPLRAMSLASALLFAACSGEKQAPAGAAPATNASVADASPGPAPTGSGAAPLAASARLAGGSGELVNPDRSSMVFVYLVGALAPSSVVSFDAPGQKVTLEVGSARAAQT